MTRTILKYIIIPFLILLHFASSAQEVDLDYFTLDKNNDNILIKWAITRGQTCNGILITRSTDSVNFARIGEIEGVCGSPEFQQPYSFIDENPIYNKKVFYRLELGIRDFSEIISIEFIKKNEAGYQVRPQPITDNARIFFDNPQFLNYELSIYNLNSQIIYQSETNSDNFNLQTQSWPSGIYVFLIKSDKESIKGKLVII